MESEKIIESLDTLWFFSNIFSLPMSESLTRYTDGKITQSSLQDSPKSNQHQPKTPILQIEQIQTSETKDQILKSSELESKPQIVESITMGTLESVEPEKKEQRSRRDKRSLTTSGKRRGKDQTEKQNFSEVEGFRDFGFNFGNIGFDDRLVPMASRLQISGNSSLCYKMPPFNDGMAMKEHLRSWAHAVAYTVR